MSKKVDQAIHYFKEHFFKSPYFTENPEERDYRYRHSIRVANIGAEIAKKENMNVEAMTIACLFHDFSYKDGFETQEDWQNHGRAAARAVRQYLESVDFPETLKEEICFGIAIHADDKSDFEGTRTPFALTVSDADNIDRFDVYRIYENLQYSKFSTMTHDVQVEFVENKLERLAHLETMTFGTQTATALWQERIRYQLDFFTKLKGQLALGNQILECHF